MRPDVVIILTDEERAAPPYEGDDLRRWRHDTLTGRLGTQASEPV